ncbi:cardioacceleratory peptide receptor-like [Ruditapes philippinarum]|uniref:cardioacceleratory peptide receptor-like n=1 Tax=Ruditapes philippinarum TaxID=129788 RepID=UPI00295B708E|nr:cardioacceleratory peptide receptor-like [Ruditapes philippinarum]
MDKNSFVNVTAGTNYVQSKNQTDMSSSEPYEAAAATISLLLFIIIVCLNGLVIYILVFRKHEKSRLFYFVLNLAIADFLVGVCSVLVLGITSAMHKEWYGGDFMCRLTRFMSTTTVIASNNLLISMSVDRFLAIKYPFKVLRIGIYRNLDKCLVAGAWLISIVVSSFFIIYSRGVNANPNRADIDEQKGGCDIKLPDNWWKPYSLTVAVIIYVLPTIGITVCYVGICIIVWMKWHSRVKLSEINTDASRDRLQGDNSLKQGVLPKAKIKSIKMTMVVCLAFFLCWTPYFVVMLMYIFHPGTVGENFTLLFNCLYPLNSACNPIVFMLFNRKLFTCDTCGKNDQHAVQSYEDRDTQMTSI